MIKVRRKDLTCNIYEMTPEEFKELIEFEIYCIQIDDLKNLISNSYMAKEYVEKFKKFLELEYFKSNVWRNVRDILSNLVVWRRYCTEKQEENVQKIMLIRRLKKLKGQISFIDDFSLLSNEEYKRANKEPDGFIEDLKLANKDLEKDIKLANFIMAYIANKNFIDALK